jgi:hypothetical protein
LAVGLASGSLSGGTISHDFPRIGGRGSAAFFKLFLEKLDSQVERDKIKRIFSRFIPDSGDPDPNWNNDDARHHNRLNQTGLFSVPAPPFAIAGGGVFSCAAGGQPVRTPSATLSKTEAHSVAGSIALPLAKETPPIPP